MNNFEIQYWLGELGQPVKVDGVVGPRTISAIKKALAKHGHKQFSKAAEDRIQVAFEQLVYKIVGGLATGPIDGIVGPATRKARKHWLRGPWRSGVVERLNGDDARLPAKLTVWPRYSELREFYGEPGQNLTTISVPFELRLSWQLQTRVRRVTCHKKVADSLLVVLENIRNTYGLKDVQKLNIDVWGGCYSPRPMRGGTKLSTHAWGIAWDTDPIRNPLRANHTTAALAQTIYDPFWKAWTDEGWTSLGLARDFDWMHTQACQL